MSPEATRCGALTRAQIVAMRAEGVSVDVIAERACVTRSTMYVRLSLWGITTRPGGDRRSGVWRMLMAEQLAASMAGATP